MCKLKGMAVFMSCALFSSVSFGSANKVKKDFWIKHKNSRIGIAIIQHEPDCGIYIYKKCFQADNQYFKNVLKDESSWNAYLKDMSLKRFEQIKTDFKDKLISQGFNVKDIVEPIKPEWISKVNFDFTKIAIKEEIDVLITFKVLEYGVLNEYDKDVLSRSSAIFNVRGDMLELKNGKMRGGWKKQLWRCSFPDRKNTVTIEGDWNQPPDYPKVTEALNKAMDNAREYLISSFFENTPSK